MVFAVPPQITFNVCSLKDFEQYSLCHSVPKFYLHLQEKKEMCGSGHLCVCNQEAANGRWKTAFLHRLE